ncbi:MAG TPA: hypothetical protein PKA70_18785 [Saprospiraceae bacterium]|nr:hypothetical protein [Saprospiraceae bacterium]
MKTIILFSFFAVFLLLSACTKKIAQVTNGTEYTIKKIQKKNSWYIIYAEKKDTLYKIVSKTDNDIYRDYEKIKVGFGYNIDIHSQKDTSPIIGGVKLDPVGYTGCYQFDSETNICLEPEKGIYDLYFASNLKGIYIVKQRRN